MKFELPPWVGRLAAVVILLVPLTVGYLGLVRPLLDSYAANRQDIEQQQALLQRYREIGARVPALEAQRATLRDAPGSQAGFLQGANEVLIAAQLQDQLKRLVEASQGGLQSTQVLAVRDEGKFRRVAIRGQMVLSMAGLQRVVYGLETGSPTLFLDNLDLRPHVDANTPETSIDSLDVGFDLYGYLATGGQ
jgi:general secretion pathway protein M